MEWLSLTSQLKKNVLRILKRSGMELMLLWWLQESCSVKNCSTGQLAFSSKHFTTYKPELVLFPTVVFTMWHFLKNLRFGATPRSSASCLKAEKICKKKLKTHTHTHTHTEGWEVTKVLYSSTVNAMVLHMSTPLHFREKCIYSTAFIWQLKLLVTLQINILKNFSLMTL